MEIKQNAIVVSNDIDKSLKHIESMLSEIPASQVANKLPVPIDTRYAESLCSLNDLYYGMFANMQNSLDYVPFLIFEKGTKAITKAYLRDVKLLKKAYKKLIRDEMQKNKKDCQESK